MKNTKTLKVPRESKAKVKFIKKHLLNDGKLSDFGDRTAEYLFFFMRDNADFFKDLAWKKQRRCMTIEEINKRKAVKACI